MGDAAFGGPLFEQSIRNRTWNLRNNYDDDGDDDDDEGDDDDDGNGDGDGDGDDDGDGDRWHIA